jgi:hypothetical protein
MAMPGYRYERQCRTPRSEQYVIWQEALQVGRVDLHFGDNVVHALLAVEEKHTEDDIMDLIDSIDEELVTAADVVRDDFVVAVYQGREVGVYTDEFFEGDEDEEEEEDEEEPKH